MCHSARGSPSMHARHSGLPLQGILNRIRIVSIGPHFPASIGRRRIATCGTGIECCNVKGVVDIAFPQFERCCSVLDSKRHSDRPVIHRIQGPA